MSRWSARIGPSGSHHAPAIRSKRATSSGSTVGDARSVMRSSFRGCLASARPRAEGRRREAQAGVRPLTPSPAGNLSRASRAGEPDPPETRRMARLVMKFGGTSVANVERIRNVARHVKREVEAGHEVAVVVSAMSGKTNELVGWCKEAGPALRPARI